MYNKLSAGIGPTYFWFIALDVKYHVGCEYGEWLYLAQGRVIGRLL
jgi:hypothetical protein